MQRETGKKTNIQFVNVSGYVVIILSARHVFVLVMMKCLTEGNQ